MAEQTTATPATASSDPISATVTRVTEQAPKLLPGERPSEAAMRLAETPKQRKKRLEREKAADAVAKAMGQPLIERQNSLAVRIAASAAGTKKASAPKSAQKGSTTVAKTNGAKRTNGVKADGTKAIPLPGKVAKVVESMRGEAETRYATKVWRFLTKKRSSAPAKTGLTSERAASIFKKVEAVV